MKEEFNIVRIDKDLEDLIPGYLERRQGDVASILKALEKSDNEAIRIIGHTMKGSGGGYGLDRITEIGRYIEGAAKSGDREEILRQVDELSDFLSSLKVVFE